MPKWILITLLLALAIVKAEGDDAASDFGALPNLAQSNDGERQISEITAEEFERLHKEIRPRPGEARWSEISWMYDLQKARQKADAEGKPLCVWRMAGDPTGVC